LSAPSSSGSILPLSWADVLDKVAQTLRDAEAETLRAEQALAEKPAEFAKPRAADRLDERLRAMQDCLARAELVAAKAEAAALQAEQAFTTWRAQLDAARQKLATTTATTV
jgi:hypothetical protein